MSGLETLTLDFASVRRARAKGASAAELVGESLRRARAVAGEGVFLALGDPATIGAKAAAIDARLGRGEALPLAGLAFSVKDNVHVAGFPTTCNCPAIDLRPVESAHAVAKLERAGAVVIGKNALDQFATGLNGTRGPEPLCLNAVDPRYVPGGSSSGSAVAVARGVVSFSIGTDTGGSGRVPAALNGIVGVKPTLGLVSGRGLVYNSRLFDTLSVFAGETAEAYEILGVMAGHDPLDPFSREDADAISLRASEPRPRVLGIPPREHLDFFGDAAAQEAFEKDLEGLAASGFTLQPVDFTPFREAGAFVFGSAFIAERLVDYGATLAFAPDAVHPAVRAAIEPGQKYSATDAFEAIYALAALKLKARRALESVDALVVPTVPTIFTIAEMLADPMTRNAALGTYTYFVNPLDLCAVAVPGLGRRDGLPSSLSVIARAGYDAQARFVAERFTESGSGRLARSPRTEALAPVS